MAKKKTKRNPARSRSRKKSVVIGDWMTRSPRSVESDKPLDAAHKLMRKHGLRHLPVFRRGKLVGVVSERDLFLLENVSDVDIDVTTVKEAMSPEVYAVSPGAPVAAVARKMAQDKYGCVVVTDDSKIVGIFTTTDALTLLADCLEAG